MTNHTPTHPTPATWADLTLPQRRDACAALLALGQAPAEIAVALNTTRAAIIGFCSRQGLRLAGRRTAASYAPPAVDIGPDGGCAPETWRGPSVPVFDHTRPLPSNACRWPIGDDARQCCGAPRVRGSYCAKHAAMAYAPAAEISEPRFDGTLRLPKMNKRDWRHIVFAGKAQRFGGCE